MSMETEPGQAADDQSFSGRELASKLKTEAPDIDSLALQDPRVAELRAQITESRAQKDIRTADKLVAENKKLIVQVKTELEKRYGVYVDPAKAEKEQEASRLDELLRIKEGLSGSESDEELLSAFKLIDGDGSPQIESPLFHGNTRRAFDKYITSVRSYKAAVESGSSLRNQQTANLARTEMHDNVARAISQDLRLDFDSARRLAAKIRDAKIPGSAESRLYVRKISDELEKYGNDLGQYMAHQKEDLDDTLREGRQ